MSVPTPTIDSATNAHELLTALASIKPENRSLALSGRGVRILAEAADLCGVDTEGMGKRSLIKAIVNNF